MKQSIEVENPPSKTELEQFWRPLYENTIQHQENEWIDTITAANETKHPMSTFTIDVDHLKNKLKEFGNFKSPGIDKLPNFWLKKLNSLLPKYVYALNKIKDGEEPTPEWLTTGQTTLNTN